MMRVLIVEDQEMVRSGLRLLCERQPHFQVVGETGDCQGALQMTLQHQPNLILLDWYLSDGCAVTCLPQLRALCEGIIIVLTGADDDEVQQQARAHGADEVLLKVIEPEVLFAHIKRLAATEDCALFAST